MSSRRAAATSRQQQASPATTAVAMGSGEIMPANSAGEVKFTWGGGSISVTSVSQNVRQPCFQKSCCMLVLFTDCSVL